MLDFIDQVRLSKKTLTIAAVFSSRVLPPLTRYRRDRLWPALASGRVGSTQTIPAS